MKKTNLGLAIVGLIMTIVFASCNKDEYSPNEPIVKPTTHSCGTQKIISDFIWDLDFGVNKIIIEHTDALRTMARTGNINPLQKQLCNWSTSRVSILQTGHISDINNVGFAPQLRVENYIIAMYHPNNYPDHFIIYNIDTKAWVRWEENGKNPKIISQS